MNNYENKIEFALGIRTQYLKDISFENPQAPEIFTKNIKPDIDISVDIKANLKDENLYEIILFFKVVYEFEGKIIFMIEIEYAGLFDLSKIKKNDLEFVSLVECPKLLFPYVRQIVSNLTSYGGFPAVLIEPVDFNSIYKQHKSKN
ncbi:MAG: protein-export chaperone SecB [Rhodospirillaceae bacterium]|nr:protein-export chaperone SecB [Rhodospirillaceae bacterium]|tara:strand:+ start:236 stop:673 length:438 start_codon:yes stop_codon:yes gene_type:complete